MTKKQALKAILFSFIFVIMLCSVTYMLRTNGTVKDIFVGFYAETEDTIDVVMIGSSPVYPFYSGPQIWGEQGITCYPLSSNVQRPKAALYLVKEALKTQSPTLFVFELRQFIAEEELMTENMAYTRGVTDNLKYSFNRIQAINALVPEEDRHTYYFDIFKYHSNWKTIVLPDQYTSFLYEREHPLKGFYLSDEVVPGEGTDLSAITETQAIPAEQEAVLLELLAYLESQGQQALFVVSPKTMTEEEQRKFNYIKEIVEAHGYDYLNLNDHYEELGIDFATDYYDGGSHTNASGAQKCSAFLGEYIREHYEIEDKRGNAKYASWDESYAYWQTCEEEALATIARKVEQGEYDEGVVE